ncbi:Etoposide-induced protein 2.4-like [Hondaea fermentalgiana]|uniref:Etoposide-induced protein 2.4-like n=1 Tax=Hondaea fermentalgiana TaxID=2315210 RepID=A0A2R5G3J6_9STRA|nr:Etoposide-induced protein 2.4-like [Hondaea fermentalgiana]|eukprot:GBG24328.1 Etoposide-induced protein 2.4-like [Hondaea fermentalgiana]
MATTETEAPSTSRTTKTRPSAWGALVLGFKSAVNWPRSLHYIATIQTTSISTQQCFVMNGTIFLGSLLAYNFVLTPLLVNLRDTLRDLLEGSEANEDVWKSAQEIVTQTSEHAFQFLWLIPMYALSLLLNAAWNLDIGKQVFLLEFGKIKGGESMAENLRDSIYNYILMAWVTLFSFLVYYVPVIGLPTSLVYTAWTASFYCYDLKWKHQGWDFRKRLRMFQSCWPFMAGFGLPCALLVTFIPAYLGYGIYCVTFPVCLVLSIVTAPVQHAPTTFLPRSLQIFVFAEWLTLAVLRTIGFDRRLGRARPDAFAGVSTSISTAVPAERVEGASGAGLESGRGR